MGQGRASEEERVLAMEGEIKARTDTETLCFYPVDHVRTIWG